MFIEHVLCGYIPGAREGGSDSLELSVEWKCNRAAVIQKRLCPWIVLWFSRVC